MYNYIIGKINNIENNFIILENNGIGYQIFVANPYAFEIEKEYQVYIYQYIREDENTLYGFKTLEEKSLFLKLISVKGLGPKITLPILLGSIDGVIDAINRENVLYLTKFPKIGDKLARQIILDLKGKLKTIDNVIDNSKDEIINVLKNLGYKDKEIQGVINQISNNISIEEQIKEALKLMLK
ncbi:MAG: Holliday junction branch migration protein RuvA [Tenericutes bacterium]|jgi:Holliday junction DNA helicase RuvA|nr:Holliday junction branch migration protein RuvA [Mycoplasmatota bacterium]